MLEYNVGIITPQANRSSSQGEQGGRQNGPIEIPVMVPSYPISI